MASYTVAIGEFIGSFVFFAVILVNGTPIAVAAAQLAPAVSLMKYVLHDIDAFELVTMIIMQLLAAVCAIAWATAKKS